MTIHRLAMSASWCRALTCAFVLGVARPLMGQGLPSARPEDVGLSRAALDSIPTVLGRYVEAKKMAGAVVAVARHGKVAYLRAIGLMDVDSAKPMRTDAIFRVMSMVKPIVTVGAMRLVERGQLSLDAPVAKYIPAFGATSVYAGGSLSAPRLAVPERAMTIRDLMRHTSGLTYGAFAETPADSIVRRAGVQGAAVARGWTLAQFIDTVARLPLVFSPGSAWNYGYSTDALARVVEVASGTTLDRFLDDEVLAPLHMTETAHHARPEWDSRIPRM